MNCGCGKGKLSCKNGRIEAIERDNAQNLPASAFDRHDAEILQSVEAIKVCFRVVSIRQLRTKRSDMNWSPWLLIFCSDELKLCRFQAFVSSLLSQKKDEISY